MANNTTDYILKHSKKKDKELKYDFMPSMLEIIERPAHIGGKVIIYSILAMLIAAVLWACFSKVDVVVTATGSVNPVGDVVSIKSYGSGVVEAILVSEGQYVSAGDILLKLDAESLQIDVKHLNFQIEAAKSQLEIFSRIAKDENLENVSLSVYSDEIKPFISAILESEKSYKNTLDGLELDKSTADLNRQLAQIQLDEYKRNGSKAQRDSQELMIQQYELEYQKTELAIKDAKNQHDSQLNQNISSLNQQLTELTANLEKYNLSKYYGQITSPIDGYIGSIAVNSKGDVVGSAQDLFTIVPADSEYEVVCYVKNMDIADIEVGDETAVKLEAYPYNKYGTVTGTISYISPSSFQIEQLGSVYLVRIKPENVGNSIKIMSGLNGSVEIKTGQRSVMRYFLDPIIKGFGESLREK